MAQQLHRAHDKSQERQSQQSFQQEGGGREEGREQQQQGGRQQGMQGRSNGGQQRSQQGQGRTASLSVPMIAMRGVGQLYDMQVAAARIMLQTQASAACAFGWPDFSGLFKIADDRAKRVFSAGTEQILHLAEQANQATSEVQRQVGRMLEFHTVNAAENWQHGLEELGAQAEESLEELKELARQQAEEAMRAAQAMGEQARESMREGGEQFRQTLHQGAEQGRENVAQMGEAGREEAEQAGASAREGAREGGEQGRGEEEHQGGQEQRPGQRRRAA